MKAHDLEVLLHSTNPPRLILVLPPEVYTAARIPGSLNACVYEVAFEDQVRALVPDPSTSIVVYGAGSGSLDAETAVEKLGAAGYVAVESFDGGLEEWKSAGLPLDGSGQLPLPPVLDGTYALDPAETVIRWTGRNLFNAHYGTVRCSAGDVILREGRLVSAQFTVDMQSIACDDLAEVSLNAMLISHLRSGDFFDIATHPTAEFKTEEVEQIPGNTEGTPNYFLKGLFTLRGITRDLSFPVLVAPSEDGKHLTAQAQFHFDRTEFGSRYGSGKWFRFLGKHLVNDYVHLHVKVRAERPD